jgi:hypothetical protein
MAVFVLPWWWLGWYTTTMAWSPSTHRWNPLVTNSHKARTIAAARPTCVRRGVGSLAQSTPDDYDTRRLLLRDAVTSFESGQVATAVDQFNQLIALQPSIQPFLWQRGISLYYANEFSLASQQFRKDVTVNPVDVEEIVWDIACQLRMNEAAATPTRALSLPKGKTDPRPVMVSLFKRGALECFVRLIHFYRRCQSIACIAARVRKQPWRDVFFPMLLWIEMSFMLYSTWAC